MILFSSSTIDFIVPIRGFYLLINMVDSDPHLVSLFMLPLFHVFEFFMLVRAIIVEEMLIFM